MKAKVTIYDISKEIGMSAATVSRALNDHPKISLSTKELVKKTAKEMGYTQNRLAQALKSGRSKNVGIIVPYINRTFFSSVIRGIEEELTPHGYHVIICQTHENFENEIEQIDTLLHTQIGGIFMSVSKTTKTTEHIQKALNENVPLVFFDRKKNVQGVSSVVIDDYKAGFLATEHLIKQGCTKIAHLSGDLNLDIYKERYNGYIYALKKHNLKVNPQYVIKINSKIESGISAVKKLWRLKEKPDGIFSASDFTALGAIQQLKKMEVKIPEEVCVIGFSNEIFTKYMELPISSIDQTPLTMGKIAAQVFLEKVSSNGSLQIEKKVVLTPELKLRGSSLRH